MTSLRLRGYARVKQDDKKRLALPSRYRSPYLAALGEDWSRDLVCALHFKLDCLVLWLPEEHDAFADDMESRGSFDEHVGITLFRAVDHCADVAIDKQWRMLIPQDLRERAKIGEDIVMLGRGSQIQIWNAEIYEQYFDEASRLAKEMGPAPSEAMRGIG